MPTSANIHGHEILHLVQATPCTCATLTTQVIQRFGADARFCTCSLRNLTLNELLGFLLTHEKLVMHQGQLAVNMAHICADDK